MIPQNHPLDSLKTRNYCAQCHNNFDFKVP